MKNRRFKGFPVVLLCTAGILLCFGIYFLVDRIFNGMFVDWFVKQYTITELTDDGRWVSVPIWHQVKALVLFGLVLNIIFWILVMVLVSHFHAKTRVRETVSRIAEKIHFYMKNSEDDSLIFPSEYGEIAGQMAEIKTSIQRQEQILKEEADRKNDLITYLAHDLKTPLTSVIGYLTLMKEAPELPPEIKAKYMDITLDKALRLESLINEFFDITRYNLQQISLEKETIDLYYMMVQMADEFYPALQAHGNSIELHMNEEMAVYGDAEKLARVFNNILKNAIAYSYADTVIVITGEVNDNMCRVSIRNKGKTIPKAKLDFIFEKFFRLDEARTTRTGGAGLGLAIAKEIVRLHGGTITADSRDESTVFTVTLAQKQ